MATSIIRNETRRITSLLVQMTEMVILNHKLAAKAIHDVDKEMGLEVLDNDRKIDAKFYEIQSELEFIITKAPVAIEMRRTLASLYIVKDLERIGDYAKHIAKFVIKSETIDSSSIKRIEKVHKEFMKMLVDVKSLLQSESNDQAIKLADKDKTVNEIVQCIRKEIVSSIAIKPSKKEIEQRLFMGNVINALERAADHVVIICELITYIATGGHGSYN